MARKNKATGITVRRSSPDSRRLFLLGGLLGVAAFLLIYGLTPLDVTNDAFCRGGYLEKDVQQHYAGWLFYRNSALGFPLGIARGVYYPEGLSVVYTDSLPLFAVVFRLFAAVLPQTFQYFGWATLLFFFLQGGFGALLFGLFLPQKLSLLGALLVTVSPVLLERAFRHTSLGAQFFVLAALYWYFRGMREDRFALPWLFFLNVLTVTIHPYFTPMTFAVTLALLAQFSVKHRRIIKPAVFLLANLAAAAFVAWCFGYFYGSATSGGQALYGYFGMNLNSLWNPAGVTGTDYSLFLPTQNQTNGNYDAFAYLGAGVLLGLVLTVLGGAVFHGKLRLAAALRRHWMLVVVCAVLSVFATSNVITANGVTLVSLPLPAALVKLFSVFRSGGRLFWPVYYLLMLAAVTGVYRLSGRMFPQRASFPAAAVCGLAALQLIDLAPGMAARSAQFREACQTETFSSSLTGDLWQKAASRYQHLISLDGIQDDALHLALYAADAGMTTNDPFAARYDETAYTAQADAARKELMAGQLREDTLYLFCDEGDFLQAVDAVCGDAWCGCVQNGELAWYVIAPGMQDDPPQSNVIAYDENYPLRMADYTDALWNHGVLDEDRSVICFKDSPFARDKLENAAALEADGQTYAILKLDDRDPGWLMVTLDIDDATVLWGKELETINK